MNEEIILSRARDWIKYDPNEKTSQHVAELLTTNDMKALASLFSQRLAFGTAGLRARMGPGMNAMNDYVVLQTTQGVCQYLEDTLSLAVVQSKGVVVGYDHRSNSEWELNSCHFARIISSVFLSKGIPVHLFSKFVPTPFVPFAVDELGAAAGIMVTASHNPKFDNGYKLYWTNGCQIISPHDAEIQIRIQQNLCPWIESSQVITASRLSLNTYASSIQGSSLLTDPLQDISTSYYAQLQSQLCRYPKENQQNPVKVCYTAMHGVGHIFAAQAFEAFGHPAYVPVESQLHPDPAFPTVAFPNPEEGKGALALAISTAEEHNCQLILANDPDADRLAVAEKKADSWMIFSGNEIGVLLGHWEWIQYQKQQAQNPQGKKVVMIGSTVSSKMLQAIARKEGFEFIETLTGFKWIGNKANELRIQEQCDVLFGYEEAIGFCVGNLVKDKDGISAAAVMVEMANSIYHHQGLTLQDHYEALCREYGYFLHHNHYVICQDKSLIQQIFQRLRNQGQYWTSLGPNYPIASIRDMTTGYDSAQPDQKTTLPITKSVEMITYTFENGVVATLRTSGTEPKIKYYIEIGGTPGKTKDEIQQELDAFVPVFIHEMLQSDIHAFG